MIQDASGIEPRAALLRWLTIQQKIAKGGRLVVHRSLPRFAPTSAHVGVKANAVQRTGES